MQPLSAASAVNAEKVAKGTARFFVFNAAPRFRCNRSGSLALTAGMGEALATMVSFAHTLPRNPSVNVTEAVLTRKSVRQFLPTPVAPDIIRRVLSTAARSPSGGNLQPWHIQVVGGEALTRLKHIMSERISEAPTGEEKEYNIYPPSLHSPYRERRFQVGEDLYRSIGIARENRPARLAQFARNFRFFDAPLALFCSIDRRMGPPQWSDLGMFLQSVMLLLREEGLHSCPQECWAQYPQTIGSFLDLPEDRMLFTGMAIGYEDTNAPINQWRSQRTPLEEFTEFIGI
jgi:nitroreductase